MDKIKVNQKTGQVALLKGSDYQVYEPSQYKWNTETGEYAFPTGESDETGAPVFDIINPQITKTKEVKGPRAIGTTTQKYTDQEKLPAPPIGVDTNADKKDDYFLPRGESEANWKTKAMGYANFIPFADEAISGVLALQHAGAAGGYGKAYDAIHPIVQARSGEAKRVDPAGFLGGQLVGNALTLGVGPTVSGAKYLAASKGPLSLIGRSARVGGLYGGVYGAGEGDDLGARAANAAKGAAAGAVAGAAIPGVPAGVRAGAKTSGALLQPFTRAGQEQIAANTLRRVAGEDVSGLLAKPLEAPVPGSLPTTGQQTQNYGLLATENALTADPAIGAQLAERSAANNTARVQAINAQAPEGVGAANVQEAVRREMQRFTNATDDMISTATQRAQQALQQVGPQISSQDAGRIIRQSVQEAYDAHRGSVSQAYNAIDPDGSTSIDFRPVWTAIAPAITERFVERTGGMPQQLIPILQRLRNTENTSVRSADRIRKELYNISSQAGVSGDRDLASAATDIARAMESHLDEVASGATAGVLSTGQREQFALARTLRNNQGDLYESGAMGGAVDRGPYGRYTVQDSDVPGRLLSGSPEAAQQLIGSVGQNPQAMQAARASLATSFRQAATRPDGGIDANAAQRWLTNNQEMLAQFPDIATAARQAIDQQRRVVGLTERQTDASRRIESSPVGQLLGDKNPDKVVLDILSGPTSVANTEGLLRTIGNDENAKNGLKRSIVDYLQSRTTGQLNIQGDNNLAQNQYNQALGKLRPVMAKLFNAEELKALEAVGVDLKRQQLNSAARGVGSNTVHNLSTNNIIDQTAGSRAVNNPLAQALASYGPNWIYRASDQQIRQILGDALLNPDVAKGILSRRTPKSIPTAPGLLGQRLPAITGAGGGQLLATGGH